MLFLWLLAALIAVISSTPLDDYVWKYDENYKWVDLVSIIVLIFLFIMPFLF
jgi:hypothetical protein